MFHGQKDPNNAKILKVQHFIKETILDKITVDKLVNLTLVVSRSLEKSYKKATKNSIIIHSEGKSRSSQKEF